MSDIMMNGGFNLMDDIFGDEFASADAAPENKMKEVKVSKEDMKELVRMLNKASDDYYNGTESVSDREYDEMFDRLLAMEKETGVVLPDSPTQKVGAEAVSKLEKVQHEYPALSLDKTKDPSELIKWLNGRKAVLSWKMDGLTVVLTYDDGKLTDAVTRGNGYIGERIMHNVPHFDGIPVRIPEKGHVVVRGEAVMHYSEFERINENREEDEDDYKNPRNLASGTVRALDSSVCEERKITFYAFQFVTGYKGNSFGGQLDELKSYGFNTVEWMYTDVDSLDNDIVYFKSSIGNVDFPSDGLVLMYDDTAYGLSLGSTSHHPRYGMAFKWKDEMKETVLTDIKWSASRTGLLNPVAVFDPVELEGTTVTRASLHNISYIMDNDLRIGDRIGVYKANMIIPQIGKNYSTDDERQRVKISSQYHLAETCPVCGEKTGIHTSDDDVMTLICVNPYCAAKHIGKLVHFCERDCMNIEGMSEKTITRFVQEGFVKEYADFFMLSRYEDEIVKMDGYGKKKYDNLVAAAEKARSTDFVSFIHACGIPNIGMGQAKLLKKHLDSIYDGKMGQTYVTLHPDEYDLVGFMLHLYLEEYDFSKIEGFGDVICRSLNGWIKNNLATFSEDGKEVDELLKLLKFTDQKPAGNAEMSLNGKTFVITGSLNYYKNRDELVSRIEALGGKVSGSVSKKTTALINNDITSTSGKNKKAGEVGVPVISEDTFVEKYLNGQV